MKKISMTIFVALAFGAFACAQNKAEPEAAKPATQPAPKAEAAAPAAKPAPANGVRFVALKDGAKVGTELKVNFAVTGKTVRPAGEDPEDKATGHHHVIIDGQAMAAGTVIPMDATHKHYGKGQTEATLQLTPGEHTLTLQFADGAHRSYGPEWSQTVRVVVAEAAPTPAPEVQPEPAAKK